MTGRPSLRSGASPLAAATASSRRRRYISKPTAAMWPDCSAPRRLPAPRISRSRIAPLLRLDGGAKRSEEVSVGLLGGASYPAAQLVELRETHRVRAVHDQGVRRRHVEPALHDGRGHEHVGLAFEEAPHDVLERPLRHLTVRDYETHPRH